MVKYIIVLFIFYVDIAIANIRQISNAIEPVKYFVGRKGEIDDIKHNLSIHHKVSIIGMSGIGKTQLIRTYASKNKDQYDLIWFFDCNNDLNSQFVVFAKQINNEFCQKEQCNLDETFAKAKQEVIAHLGPKKRWLLVFDNLRINQNDLIADLVNWEHNGYIIFASQDAKDLSEIVTLNELNHNDSENLVTRLLDNQQDVHTHELVNLAKGYPLLLAQSSIFYKSNKHVPINEHHHFLARFNDRTKLYVINALDQLPDSAKKLAYIVAIISNRFSKKFLKDITDNSNRFEEDLYSLIRLGLVINIKVDGEDTLFEMHDVIKQQIMQALNENQKQCIMNDILHNINELIPDDIEKAYYLIKFNGILLTNLELLFDQTKLYKSDLKEIFKLRKNLLITYIYERNYNLKSQEIVQWLLDKRKDKIFNKLLSSNDKYKVIYSRCFEMITSIYGENADYITAINMAQEANNIIDSVKGYAKDKIEIKLQLAQQYLSIANIPNVKKILHFIEQNIDLNNIDDINSGFLYFIKARTLLQEANFDDSLHIINKTIELYTEMEKYFPQNIYTSLPYILKARILNYMYCYAEANKIVKKIYIQENKLGRPKNVVLIAALIELARAELGLGNINIALKHIQEAKEALLINNIIDDLTLSQNDKLAYALVVEGDCLTALDKVDQALNNYAAAEIIYYNKYRENIKYSNEVSYLYLAACRVSCHLQDKFWFKKFRKQHLNKFGLSHPRSLEIEQMQCLN